MGDKQTDVKSVEKTGYKPSKKIEKDKDIEEMKNTSQMARNNEVRNVKYAPKREADGR